MSRDLLSHYFFGDICLEKGHCRFVLSWSFDEDMTEKI